MRIEYANRPYHMEARLYVSTSRNEFKTIDEDKIPNLRSVMVHWAAVHIQPRIHLPHQFHPVAHSPPRTLRPEMQRNNDLLTSTIFFFLHRSSSQREKTHPAFRHPAILYQQQPIWVSRTCKAVKKPSISTRLEENTDNNPTQASPRVQ